MAAQSGFSVNVAQGAATVSTKTSHTSLRHTNDDHSGSPPVPPRRRAAEADADDHGHVSGCTYRTGYGMLRFLQARQVAAFCRMLETPGTPPATPAPPWTDYVEGQYCPAGGRWLLE